MVWVKSGFCWGRGKFFRIGDSRERREGMNCRFFIFFMWFFWYVRFAVEFGV